jgi:uncharacterized protein YcbK (DUF882 family)
MRPLVLGIAALALTLPAYGKATHPRATHFRHSHQHRVATSKKSKRNRFFRLASLSPLRGSHESLVRQNMMVDQDGLERIQDDNQLMMLTQNESLLALPSNQKITVDPQLPENRRFCRPWTKSFLSAFATAHWLKFHRPLQVNSAVRTVEFQAKLRHWNGNAAGLEGQTASPHLTGATVDVAKAGMTRAELKWARDYLLGLQHDGKLDTEEEFRQPVFHITVYKAYEGEVAEQAAN